MSRKQLFILLGVLAVLCLCAIGVGVAGLAYMGNSFSKAIGNAGDPANVKKIAANIADFTPPAGYQEMAMDLMMYKYVMLTPDRANAAASGPFIMLMSYPSNTNMTDEQMQEQMQRAFSRQTGQQATMKVTETKTVSIRGKDAKVTVLEGKMNNKYMLRQWISVFTGKNGPVMLMIQGVIDDWDEKLVNDFVASIK